MKKRWLSLFVENNVGVLAKIAGMFSGKAYNLESLTVGTTDDPTISRMTIGLSSNDEIFEQIKKQLNRCVDVIKVMDFTQMDVVTKELMFIKVKECTKAERDQLFQIANVFQARIIDYGSNSILIEAVNTDKQNDDLILLVKQFNHIEIIRSGTVAIESCCKTNFSISG